MRPPLTALHHKAPASAPSIQRFMAPSSRARQNSRSQPQSQCDRKKKERHTDEKERHIITPQKRPKKDQEDTKDRFHSGSANTSTTLHLKHDHRRSGKVEVGEETGLQVTKKHNNNNSNNNNSYNCRSVWHKLKFFQSERLAERRAKHLALITFHDSATGDFHGGRSWHGRP
jgi:hypothetical protein